MTRTKPYRSHRDLQRLQTDQAAVLGASLTAVLSLTLGEGPWVALSTVIGASLLLLLAGFYTPPKLDESRRKLELGAVSAIAGLACALALAWPLQEFVVAEELVPNWNPAQDCRRDLGLSQPPDQPAQSTVQDQEQAAIDEYEFATCLADQTTTNVVPCAAIISGVAIYSVLLRRRPRDGDEKPPRRGSSSRESRKRTQMRSKWSQGRASGPARLHSV